MTEEVQDVELNESEDVVVSEAEQTQDEYDYSTPEHWSEEERTQYERLAELQKDLHQIDGRELQKLWKERYSNWDKGFNQKMREVAEQRKQAQAFEQQIRQQYGGYESLKNLVTPYVQQWHSMGHLPDQVAAQAFHWATQYYQNPVGTLVEIAKQGGFVNEVLDAINNQPYIDPAVERANRRVEQIEWQMHQQQQAARQQQMAPYIQQIRDFQGATDEAGNPRYPHAAAAWEHMAVLIRDGRASNLEDAYNQAVWSIPEAREALMKQQAQAAASEAERAEQAGKRVKAKQTGSGGNKGGSLRSALEAAIDGSGLFDD